MVPSFKFRLAVTNYAQWAVKSPPCSAWRAFAFGLTTAIKRSPPSHLTDASVFAETVLRSSYQNLLHDVACNISQAVVAAGVAVGEAFVIEAQEVQHCGVQVVGVDGSFDGQDAVLV